MKPIRSALKRVRFLSDIPEMDSPPDQDLAAVELVEAGEAVEERRLAAPGGSHDGDHLAAW